MTTTYVIVPLFIVLSITYTVWMRRRAASALTESAPAFTAFFERTGYRYFDIANLPPEAQAQRAIDDARKPAGNSELHYVRNFHGLSVHHLASHGKEQRDWRTVYYMTNRWVADLPAPPRIPVHIADKNLVSTMKAVTELLSNSERVFNPACSRLVQTGIAEIDSRFVVYGEDPEAVRWLFQQNPGLERMFYDWSELDVSVTGRHAVLSDPNRSNMQAAMGGAIGSMAIGFDYAKTLELSIPLHDRVAELLATLARATA